MRAILSLFGRRKPVQPAIVAPPVQPAIVAPPVLSAAVIAAIDTAHILSRSPGENDAPRTAVQFDGWNAFIFHDESARKFLAKAFPEMCGEQLGQGVKRLRARVKLRLRENAEMQQMLAWEADPDLRPWKYRY